MSSELPVAGQMLGAAQVSGTTSNWFAWSDWAGMIASVGCAIHCAAMPFVIAYLPALGLSFLADEAFHKWMAIGCFAIALTAFVPGLRKHGRLLPVALGSGGLVLITVAAFGFAGECCDACEAGSAMAATVPVDELGASSSSLAAETCAEGCCPHCESQAVASSSELPSKNSSQTWLVRLLPWLTPLGGLVLVSAHLLNRRYACLCGCCSTAATKAIG